MFAASHLKVLGSREVLMTKRLRHARLKKQKLKQKALVLRGVVQFTPSNFFFFPPDIQ